MLHVHCPAKLNLTLSVGSAIVDGPRRGYHPIASWMVALDFGDTLDLRRATGDGSTFERVQAADAPLPIAIDWPMEKDLAFRAHAAMEREAGRPLPVEATLHKRVPTGAGLGGGSGDAAAMIHALVELFQLRLPEERLQTIALALGSDVPFLLRTLREGEGAAVVSGLGERLEPAPLPARMQAEVLLTGLRCETAAVYRTFDAHLPPGHALQTQRVRRCDPDDLFNDLTAAAHRVAPGLAEMQARTEMHLTGSGSSLFRLRAEPKGDHADRRWLRTRVVGLGEVQ